MKKIAMFLMALAAFLLTGTMASAQAVNVTGKWNFKVETAGGSGSPVFVLKQQADSISGSYTGQLGEAPVKGTVKNKEIRLEFKSGEYTVVYTGTVDQNTMKGKVTLGEYEGTFTGTKEN